MQFTVKTVTNPVWANIEHTMIDCEVVFSHLGEMPVPFTASKNDPEAYGRELFARLEIGEFGQVAEYVPPPEPSPDAQEPPTPPIGEIPQSVL
jgi:hypothetical protein